MIGGLQRALREGTMRISLFQCGRGFVQAEGSLFVEDHLDFSAQQIAFDKIVIATVAIAFFGLGCKIGADGACARLRHRLLQELGAAQRLFTLDIIAGAAFAVGLKTTPLGDMKQDAHKFFLGEFACQGIMPEIPHSHRCFEAMGEGVGRKTGGVIVTQFLRERGMDESGLVKAMRVQDVFDLFLALCPPVDDAAQAPFGAARFGQRSARFGIFRRFKQMHAALQDVLVFVINRRKANGRNPDIYS